MESPAIHRNIVKKNWAKGPTYCITSQSQYKAQRAAATAAMRHHNGSAIRKAPVQRPHTANKYLETCKDGEERDAGRSRERRGQSET